MQLLTIKERADRINGTDLFIRDRKYVLIKHHKAGAFSDLDGANLIQQSHALRILPSEGRKLLNPPRSLPRLS